MSKLSSRKLWLCVAAFFGAVATTIAGMTTDNQTLVMVGSICQILSAGFYAVCEAWVDGKAVKARLEAEKEEEEELQVIDLDQDDKEE